ncbi:hypothetical protein Fleli_2773 [Bernardetia litoralis DSM 6794]|uniref:Lipoprotein n=1 Tax=Bernardetia litoralis (strain ATCC 23117 / DSM 6794 / NBRC 15988 / NCIMB 1366 / Fx l1 / Sio-4) TaxID=880071 RepID=I4AME1_BERLS|nr:hypothetical protein [Bernardetia litoralis]AFM05126.1 hypothetical protein Fleli_2773 [Bernardetia litoralis DSM 6794]
MKNLLILPLAILLISCGENSKEIHQVNNIKQTDTTTIIAENKVEESLPTFQIYGELAPVGYLDSENPITEKYGFIMKRIAGCAVGSDEAKKVNKNNTEALEKMNAKYGNDWQVNFEKETGFKLWIPLD